MPSDRKNPPSAVVPVRLKTESTLLICKRCSNGPALRQNLKGAIKEAGRKRDLRVIGCGCLDVCPKRGSAAVLLPRNRPGRCVVIADSAGIDAAFITELLEKGGAT